MRFIVSYSYQGMFRIFSNKAFKAKLGIHIRSSNEHGQCDFKSMKQFMIGIALVTGLTALAGENSSKVPLQPGKGWFHGYEGGAVHQFQTQMEGGSEFGVNRFLSRASFGYRSNYANSTSLSIGYMHSAYDFDGLSGMFAQEPWEAVHTLSLSAPIRRSVGEKWMLLAIPSIRSVAEDNADFTQSITGGGIAGMSYEIRPGLSLGPGFGVLTQLEDSVNVFPIILVDWKISNSLTLQTGRGFGASQGPGLTLIYAMNDAWSFMLGGRYERFRFRLNENGGVPNGVGEDRGASANMGVKYAWSKRGSVTLFGGINLLGKLEVDDNAGNEVLVQDYDSAPFIGMNASIRF